MRNILLLLFVLLMSFHSEAQYNLKENNVWAFGYYAGLDFNGDTVVPIHTAINANVSFATSPVISAASVCDTSGHLLFYTSGDSIWNKNNQAMPSGFGLLPTAVGTPCSQVYDNPDVAYLSATNASQGALIVPVLNNPNQYYVFSLQRLCGADAYSGRLYYCVVDMTLDGGLGDVVPGQKGILLDSSLSEKMISVPGDNCDMWVLVHGSNNDTFKAFEVTSAGVNPVPVVSYTGNITGALAYTTGDMEVSPNRRKLVLGSEGYFEVVGGIGGEICDFDPATGMASNAITLTTDAIYGMCFSPDGSKLYVNDFSYFIDTSGNYNISTTISQYDVTQPSINAIIASRVDIFTGPPNDGGASVLRLGPDGKLYAPSTGMYIDTNVLNTIDFPNLSGAACHFTQGAITLLDTTLIDIGLPSVYMKPLRDTIYTTTDTTLTGNLILQIPSGYFTYLWSDGTTDSSKAITDTGTYWVTYSNYCTTRTDTFVVRPSTGVATIDGQGAAALTAYPSPAHTTVTVSISGISNINGTLRIIDAVGRTVLEQPCNSRQQTLNVSDMAPGLYTVIYTDKTSPMHLQQQLVITKQE